MVEADYGTYQCLANNKHGNDTQTVELIKTKIPIPEAAFGGSLQQHSSILTILSSLAIISPRLLPSTTQLLLSSSLHFLLQPSLTTPPGLCQHTSLLL